MIRRDRWNTYKTLGYTHDVANDQRSTGGVHHHQIKLGRAGWMYRIMQSNGRWNGIGEVEPISDQQGEAHYETAKSP